MAEIYYQFNVSLYFYLLKVYFIYYNKCYDYYQISCEKKAFTYEQNTWNRIIKCVCLHI